ncbi:MAG: GNAT family N-acetyltransferase [Nocardioidaceae bacterium]
MTEIRVARRFDLDALVALEFELFGASAWSPRSVEGEFDAVGESRFIVVAEDVGAGGETAVVGYAIGAYVAGVGDAQRVAVTPGHRRRGLATRLLGELLVEAERRACERVLLEVAAANAAAVALYARAGFKAVDRRPRYYPGEVDALVMMRPCASAP